MQESVHCSGLVLKGLKSIYMINQMCPTIKDEIVLISVHIIYLHSFKFIFKTVVIQEDIYNPIATIVYV